MSFVAHPPTTVVIGTHALPPPRSSFFFSRQVQGVFDDIQKKAVEFYKTSPVAKSSSQSAEGGAAAPMSEAAKDLETKLEVRARASPTPLLLSGEQKEKASNKAGTFGSVHVIFVSSALCGAAWACVGVILHNVLSSRPCCGARFVAGGVCDHPAITHPGGDENDPHIFRVA